MSPREPMIAGRALIKTLTKRGFTISRVRESHHFLRHIEGRTTFVPVHRGETIGVELLLKILRDCEISPEDL